MNEITTQWIATALGATTNENVSVTSVVIDTKKIVKDCLFVCIKGERFDGNAFAQEALNLGAAAVLCGKTTLCDGPCVRVDDTRMAFLKLASCYRNQFTIPVVALTGSVGKTTTKEMLALVLSSKYHTLKTLGNFNNEIGLPQTLFRIDKDTQVAVIEMGMSHFDEIAALSMATKPTIGLITNIGSSHIENLGSRAGIFKAKMELLQGLADGAPLVVNADDDFLSTVQSDAHHKVYSFGLEKGDFMGYNVKEVASQTEFVVHFFGKQQAILLPSIGIHHVYDALAAFAVGYLLGVDPARAATMLALYEPEGMRQKCVTLHDTLFIEDCYNASPDSMKAAITTLLATKGKKKIAVLADMLELGEYAPQAHLKIGKLLGEGQDTVLLAFGTHAKQYIIGAKQNGFTDCYFYNSKEALVQALIGIVSKGDSVLFKGSRGMKLEEVIKAFYDKWGTVDE